MIGAAASRLRLFNLREFATHPGRTVMSLAVVAVSAALLVAVFGISGSVTGSADRLATSIGGNADLEVSGITDSGFDQGLVGEVAEVPGVEAAVPMIRMPLGTPSERVALLGADARLAALSSDLQRTVQPQLGSLVSVPGGVAIGARMGLTRGESLNLGSESVTVAAVLEGDDVDRINGGHFVMAPLPLAQRIAGREGQIDSILVVAAPDVDVSQVRADVADVVGGRAIVADPSLRTAQAGGGIALLRSLTLSAASGALVVAAFLIYNATSMAITQRRPVISMLRAIGGRRRVIVRDVLVEAALLGLVGGAIGGILGVFVGRLAIGQLPTALVQSVEARTEYLLPGYAIPVAVAACVAACVAAAALASRQVYKVAPVEALAPIGAGRADEVGRKVRVLAGLAGAALLAAAIAVATADLGRLGVGAIALASAAQIALCFAFGPAIVRATSAAARTFGAPGALAAATIDRAPRRVWATVMTVLIGVSMTVSTTGSNANVVDSATASFASLGDIDIFVSSTDPGVFPTSPLLPEGVESRVAEVAGVAQVVPGQMAYATVGGTRVMISGLTTGSAGPPSNAMAQRVRERVLAGEGVVLSRDVARSLGLSAGDQLELPTPSGVHRVEVLQVVPFFSALGGVLAMDLPRMRDWFDRPGATILGISTSPGVDRDQVAADIRATAPAGVRVFSGEESVTAVSASVRGATVLIGIMAWIVVLVAAVALLNTLMLSVLERRRELGVLRAMGSSRRFALRTVLAEAAAIGVVGGGLGVAFGAANQYLISIAMTNVVSIDVAYRAGPMLIVFATAAIALSLLGSIPPAVRAARLNIIEAVSVD
ncbi:ABC transporter permease [Rhodococcus sp. NPDC058514]|uniref:ABC transporter permease n=1 Tax=unclassified Rhodococcus (in: high G+C Gram-positive bacteria) TaxID=192944 RepID=UPI00364E5A91